jgi:hypothetical protein
MRLIVANPRSEPIISLSTWKKVLSILGCLLFLSSIVFPFRFVYYSRNVTGFPEGAEHYWAYYWSFRSYTETDGSLGYPHYGVADYWFYDCWVKFYTYDSELFWTFTFIFMIQVLTLIIGVAFIFLDKKILAPTVLCITVSVLMTLVNVSPREANVFSRASYELGYWLTYPSMLLFLSASLLGPVAKKRQTAHLQESSSSSKDTIYTPTYTETIA